jgi:hypothetical protein
MTLDNVNVGLANFWKVTCLDKDGNIKWEEDNKNIIVTAGLNHILDTQFHASTQVTTWYIGLKGAGTPIAADTMASHSSWAELTGYSGNRKEWTEGASSAGSMTNSSSVDFTINATATIAGAFLNTASTGTSGTLYGVVDFSSSRAVISGDTLQVTVTVTAASA